MENKKGSLSTVFLVIAIILIVVMGALLYIQKTDADRQIAELQKEIESISNTINSNDEDISDKTEDNEIKNKDVLGEYVYEVPQQIKDEIGHYYDGITIKLLENNKFEYYHAEGLLLKGIYSIDKANVICNVTTEEGEYVEEHKINDKYTFKYENNMLELIRYEGNESEQDNDVFERIGSKYVKNITSTESSSNNTNSLQYIEMTEDNHKKYNTGKNKFIYEDIINNNDKTITIKGRVYEEIELPTITKEQYQDLIADKTIELLGYKMKVCETNVYGGHDLLIESTTDDGMAFYVDKNSDGTGTLMYRSEIALYKKTNTYMKITVDESIPTEGYSLKQLVGNNVLENQDSQELRMLPGLNDCYIFENGKCTSITFSTN